MTLQGRRDVGKSVHVRQAIMQLDSYHVRRGSVQKTANKVVYNDGRRLLFAYPFLDVAALMDLLYISRSSAVRPTLHSQVHHNVTTSFSQYLWSFFCLCVSPCFCSGSTSMWQLKICTFIMRCLILLFVAFHSFSCL